MALTDTACRNAKPKEKPYRLYDRDGLYMEVSPSGGRYWRAKYRYLGKEKRLALGIYPVVGLQGAREKLDDARKLLDAQKDPSAVKRQRLEALKRDSTNTFEPLAREWHTKNNKGWTARYGDYVLRRLEADVFPIIGKLPVSQIKPRNVIDVMRSIESRGAAELARRQRQVINQIFRYAVVEGYTSENPVSVFESKDVLEPYAKGHYAALEVRELPDFVKALDKNDARLYQQTRLAVRMLMLTFVRTTELIEAEWGEIDLDGGEWLIPAHRMKMRQPHIVPLSRQVVEILRQLQAYRVEKSHQDWPDYVFPNQARPRKAMSNNTILKAIERLGYKGRMTGHGFRALAMSTIKEKLGYRHEVVDRQLAHAPRNKVDAAYDRAKFLDERRVMMQQWADYLDGLVKDEGKVVLGKFGRAA